MVEPVASRRSLLKGTGMVLCAAALAGCPGDTASESAIDRVPEPARFVAHADVARLLEDQRLRDGLDDFLAESAEFPQGINSVEDATEGFEEAAGLDVRKLRQTTVFFGYRPDGPGGVRLEADWSTAAVRNAIDSPYVDPETDEHNGRTVYRYSDETALGVLGEGTYVTGTTAGVEGVIDVAEGDAKPVGGRVREAYSAAPTGALRFGFEPPDRMAADAGRPEGPVDFAPFASITHGYGGYAVGGDGSITLVTDSADAAARIATALRNARDAMLEGQFRPMARWTLSARVEEALSALRIRAEDTAVRTTAREGTLLPVALLTVLLGPVLGVGGRRQPVAPTTDFEFAWDSDAGALSITHRAGDSVPAAELSVRGTGLGTTGGWRDLGGSASGRTKGKPAVISGDSVTLQADPDYVARVIWEDGDGDTVSQLGSDRGPEALE